MNNQALVRSASWPPRRRDADLQRASHRHVALPLMPTAEKDRIDAHLLQQYCSVHALGPWDATIAVLRIGPQHSQLLIGYEARPQSNFPLANGSQTIAHEYLLHTPPLPTELEGAILAIEEQIAAAHITTAAGARLYSSDPIVRRIAHLLPGSREEPLSLSTDVVQCAFNPLVNVALGRPAAHDALPLDIDFVATLLMLRELLHHLQFSSITVFA